MRLDDDVEIKIAVAAAVDALSSLARQAQALIFAGRPDDRDLAGIEERLELVAGLPPGADDRGLLDVGVAIAAVSMGLRKPAILLDFALPRMASTAVRTCGTAVIRMTAVVGCIARVVRSTSVARSPTSDIAESRSVPPVTSTVRSSSSQSVARSSSSEHPLARATSTPWPARPNLNPPKKTPATISIRTESLSPCPTP